MHEQSSNLIGLQPRHTGETSMKRKNTSESDMTGNVRYRTFKTVHHEMRSVKWSGIGLRGVPECAESHLEFKIQQGPSKYINTRGSCLMFELKSNGFDRHPGSTVGFADSVLSLFSRIELTSVDGSVIDSCSDPGLVSFVTRATLVDSRSRGIEAGLGYKTRNLFKRYTIPLPRLLGVFSTEVLLSSSVLDGCTLRLFPRLELASAFDAFAFAVKETALPDERLSPPITLTDMLNAPRTCTALTSVSATNINDNEHPTDLGEYVPIINGSFGTPLLQYGIVESLMSAQAKFCSYTRPESLKVTVPHPLPFIPVGAWSISINNPLLILDEYQLTKEADVDNQEEYRLHGTVLEFISFDTYVKQTPFGTDAGTIEFDVPRSIGALQRVHVKLVPEFESMETQRQFGHNLGRVQRRISSVVNGGATAAHHMALFHTPDSDWGFQKIQLRVGNVLLPDEPITNTETGLFQTLHCNGKIHDYSAGDVSDSISNRFNLCDFVSFAVAPDPFTSSTLSTRNDRHSKIGGMVPGARARYAQSINFDHKLEVRATVNSHPNTFREFSHDGETTQFKAIDTRPSTQILVVVNELLRRVVFKPGASIAFQ